MQEICSFQFNRSQKNEKKTMSKKTTRLIAQNFENSNKAGHVTGSTGIQSAWDHMESFIKHFFLCLLMNEKEYLKGTESWLVSLKQSMVSQEKTEQDGSHTTRSKQHLLSQRDLKSIADVIGL